MERNRIILNAGESKTDRKISLAANSEKNKRNETDSTFIKKQFKNYDENLIPRLWQYAKFSGFRTMQQAYFIQPDFGSLKVAEP